MSRAKCDEDRRMEKFTSIYDRWLGRELSEAEAGELLGRSERQFRRYKGLYEDGGLEALRDGRLGRPSSNATPQAVIDAILELYRRDHQGWNVKHFHDHLVRHHNFTLSYSLVKSRLQHAGLVRVKPQKGGHRKKRERKPCVGMMLHQDGSRAEWLAGQPMLDLIVTMDDATSVIYSAFLVAEEGTLSTLRALLEVFCAHGVPASLYTDRGSHYFTTPEAGGEVDKAHKTHVGRALDRLGVEHIPAYSPQARGRSERVFGTLQDRLIKELALAGIVDIEAANRWIRDVYLPDHNARFGHEAALPESGFVKVDRERLIETLVIEEERTVGRDNTIGWAGRRLQVPESPLRRHYVGAKVKVHVYPDETLGVLHGPRVIARFTAKGEPLVGACAGASRQERVETGASEAIGAAASVAPRSVPSRCGLETAAPASRPECRPTLTGPSRGAKGLPCPKAKKRAA
jgi:transposase